MNYIFVFHVLSYIVTVCDCQAAIKVTLLYFAWAPSTATAAAAAGHQSERGTAAAVRCRPAAFLRELWFRLDIGDGGRRFERTNERRVAAGQLNVVEGRNGSAVGLQRIPTAAAAAHDEPIESPTQERLAVVGQLDRRAGNVISYILWQAEFISGGRDDWSINWSTIPEHEF